MSLKHRIALNPQLQQAIKLLPLSVAELEAEILNTVETNPLLELTEGSLTPTPLYFSSGTDFIPESASSAPYSPPNPEPTLRQSLLWQMELTSLSSIEQVLAVTLIDAISEEGYLVASLDELRETLPPSISRTALEKVLQTIQQFEPIGVGARTLSECLLIQLNALPSSARLSKTKALVQDYLKLLAAKNYAELQKVLQITEQELTEIVQLLRTLNPRPGLSLLSQKSDYIVPDLKAWLDNGVLQIELNESTLPSLRVNTAYLAHSNSKQIASSLYFRQHHQEAQYFLKGLETRRKTLLNVSRCILEHQKDFFEQGVEGLKPLTLQTIATQLHLHESTISRAIAHKYILTPRGIYSFKHFFTHGRLAHPESLHTPKAIQAHIRTLISAEKPGAPLSDQTLTQKLHEQGIQIARRTVTKYREGMNIASSQIRRCPF